MSYVNRANDVDTARRVLGVSPCASQLEIRAAWKRIAFQTHPDRNPGKQREFERAKAAHELLKRMAPETAGRVQRAPSGPAARRPPSIRRRTEPLSHKVIDECREALETCGPGRPGASGDMIVGLGCRDAGAGGSTTDHLPLEVERQGRALVFVVPSTIAAGRNRVALPTALLKNKRRSEPKVFEFDAGQAGIEEFRIPESTISWAFPGARSVLLHFGRS